MKVWMDGRIMDGAEARVPVTDHGFLYGDGVFEGLRVYNGRMFRLEAHLARLEVSARALDLDIPGGTEEVRRVVLATVAASGMREGYVRVIVTRGEGPLGIDPTTCARSRLVCLVDAVELFPAAKRERGVSLVTSSLRRPGPDVLDPRIKSLNYLNNVLAKQEAHRAGADDALLLNAAGHVAEASGANLFAVLGGSLVTPPATDGALPGITRAAVLELARDAGMPTFERTLGRVELFAADEVFLTGSGARIVAVGELDGRSIGRVVPGPVTARLTQAFLELASTSGTPVPYAEARP